MPLRTWLVAALGLGSLVALIAISMLASARTAQDIYVQLDELNRHHRRVEESLRRLRSDVNLSGIYVRDYLLDIARERAPEYRQQIAEFRRTTLATLAELKTLIAHDDQIAILESKLDEYWLVFEPLFDWTTTEKIGRSANFLRREVVPRREAALAIAREIEQLNNDNLAAQQQEVARRQSAVGDELAQAVANDFSRSRGVDGRRLALAGTRTKVRPRRTSNARALATAGKRAVAAVLVEDYVRQLQQRGLTDSYHLLTDREKEVLQLLAEGRSNKEVATLLTLGLSTVKTHRANLVQKLNLHNTAEIVLYAVRKGLIV
jgi:DNA-binding CsgD family transcriptional regulator